MKLDARRVEGFLANPGACRVVLLHGEDGGLVRERAAALVRGAAGALDDPFRVAELERDGIGRIEAEMASRPMTGGRRVVRVRDVTDAAAQAVQAVLASNAEGFLVMEAGELTGRSKLRSLVEAAADGAAIACYAETGPELRQTILSAMSEAGLRAEPEALNFLCDHLGNDRGATRQELQKIALYVQPRTAVTLDDVLALTGDMAGLQIDDALFAAISGDVGTADRALGLALGEGANPVSVLRATLMHMQRLERVKLAMAEGQSAMEAVKSLRPPVFFRRQPALAKAAGYWSGEGIAAACAAAWEAERDCKRTGSPAVSLCRHVVLSIARRGARGGGR
jgi:DNA polymerase-3 subunit delta